MVSSAVHCSCWSGDIDVCGQWLLDKESSMLQIQTNSYELLTEGKTAGESVNLIIIFEIACGDCTSH